MNAIGQQIQRPINDWCPEADLPNTATGLCDDGSTAGPAVAEGWDDWGPLLHADVRPARRPERLDRRDVPGHAAPCGGRVGSRRAQEVVSWSTLAATTPTNRHDLYSDMLEIYRRGDTDAAQAGLLPGAVRRRRTTGCSTYPQAYVIPRRRRPAERRRGQPARRVAASSTTSRCTRSRSDYRYGGQTYSQGLVRRLHEPAAARAGRHRALDRRRHLRREISRLYAPPGAWSHGYLWGADVVTIPDGRHVPAVEATS